LLFWTVDREEGGVDENTISERDAAVGGTVAKESGSGEAEANRFKADESLLPCPRWLWSGRMVAAVEAIATEIKISRSRFGDQTILLDCY
jgi:hypothetical protein